MNVPQLESRPILHLLITQTLIAPGHGVKGRVKPQIQAVWVGSQLLLTSHVFSPGPV